MVGPQRLGQPRRDRPHLVPAAAEPARPTSIRRARGHDRLQGRARHRHLQLRHARRAGRGRSGNRRRRNSRLCGRRGRRQAGQSDDRRRSDLRRHRARASAPRCTRRCRSTRGTAARLDVRRLPAAGPDRGAGDPRLDHMETPSPYTEFGSQGHRRGRRDRAAGGDRQRRERCAAAISASRLLHSPDHAAADPRRRLRRAARAEARRETGYVRLRAPERRRRGDARSAPREEHVREVSGGRAVARADAQPAPGAARPAGRHHGIAGATRRRGRSATPSRSAPASPTPRSRTAACPT